MAKHKHESTEKDAAAVGRDPTANLPPEEEEVAQDVGELSEADILRDELSKARTEAEDFRERFLRARADLENYRRRAAQEVTRARDAGLDSAILPLLSVFDDLQRALAVSTDDPTQLIPGIKAVNDGLLRNLSNFGIQQVGVQGEPFDPEVHEALTALPTQDISAADTIAEVMQVGFKKDERLIRPAKVVVYQG